MGAVVIDSGRLLLVQRGKDPYQGCWAVPGGKVRWGESLIAAVKREIEEETGLVVKVGEVIWVGETIGPPDRVPGYHNVLIDFAADTVGGVLRSGSDAVDAAFVPLAEVRRLPLTPTMYELLDILDPPPVYHVTAHQRLPDSADPSRRTYASHSQRSIRS